MHERTGRSIIDRIDARISSMQRSFSSLPSERAQEIQARLRAARDAQIRIAEHEQLKARILSLSDKQRREPDPVLMEEIQKLKARQAQEEDVVRRLWMGGESEGWKERRLREEQKALSEGKGYGDLIQEHIWDVWTWGGKDGKAGEGVTDENVAEKKD